MNVTIIDIGRPVVISILVFILSCLLQPVMASSSSTEDKGYEIFVHTGEVGKSIDFLKSRNYWGADRHSKDLDVPRIILAVTSDRWEKESRNLEVEVKKEFFYRVIVPMILLSNELILEDRADIETIGQQMKTGDTIEPEQQARLNTFAEQYGLEEITEPGELISQLLERVDSIPPSLALGQAAYESGYGTSRFAREGNALFGQWTYSGDGMKPKEHRASKGDYGVASYRWPFESVRSYMLNLNTHSAYQPLREKRAALRDQGKEPTGLELTETLENYSERGMEYVKTLKDIITVNNLAVLDQASLRDEPVILTVGVTSEQETAEIESKIEQLRASGELDRIVRQMRLE
jgi:Bax protein